MDQTGISRRYCTFTSHTQEALHKEDNCSECCNCSSLIQRLIAAISQFKRSVNEITCKASKQTYAAKYRQTELEYAVLEGLQKRGWEPLVYGYEFIPFNNSLSKFC